MTDRNIIKMNEKKSSGEFSEIVEILQEDVIIPEVVMKKANLAFDAIKMEQNEQEVQAMKKQNRNERNITSVGRRKVSRKKICILAAAAVLAVGGVTAGASAYMKWSKSLSEGMQATEEQKIKAEETNLAVPVNKIAEVDGIKVTAVQSIVDSHYAMISFKVDGYREICPEGEQPFFGECKVWVDGYNPEEEGGYDTEKNFAMDGAVYNGYVIRGEDGVVVKAVDGTTMEDAKKNGTFNYFLEDGSFEWIVTLSNEEAEGTFIDKPIHIELKNLGTAAKVAVDPDIEGTWSFEWTLTGNDERKVTDLDAPLGDSGAKITQVKLSPLSISLTYNCTDKTSRPPRFWGVRLKDGRCWPYILMGSGKDSSLPDEKGDFFTIFAFNRILDVNEVEALLFSKSLPIAEEAVELRTMDENCYVVPLEG